MRYRLRTLLIVAAIGPPVLAGGFYLLRWLALYLWLVSQPQGIKSISWDDVGGPGKIDDYQAVTRLESAPDAP